MKRRHQALWTIFAAPLAIGAMSCAGLVLALTGDGWRNTVSWAGLAVPVLVVAWAMKARRS